MAFLGLGRKDRKPPEPVEINTDRIPFTTSIIENPLLNLPAVIHDPITHKYEPLREDDLASFVQKDLTVKRIEDVQKHLWICGAKGRQRPLHRQKGLYSRQIVVNEQADLHLTWDAESLKMFMKPLPAYLLNHEFWEKNICDDEKTFQNALGFLRSYVHLIPHEIDLDHALEERLLPRIHAAGNNGGDYSKGEDITWPQWRAFVNEFLTEYEDATPDELRSTRWEYSELRQGRLNLLYRIFMGAVFRGYNFGYASYGSFLSRNSSWLIAAFAYVAIAHGAMQVGLSTPQLEGNEAFARACYGFAVFSIVAPVGILSIIITWMILLFFNNLIWTSKENRKNRPPRTPRDAEAQAAAKRASNRPSATAPHHRMHPSIPASPPHQNGTPQ